MWVFPLIWLSESTLTLSLSLALGLTVYEVWRSPTGSFDAPHRPARTPTRPEQQCRPVQEVQAGAGNAEGSLPSFVVGSRQSCYTVWRSDSSAMYSKNVSEMSRRGRSMFSWPFAHSSIRVGINHFHPPPPRLGFPESRRPLHSRTPLSGPQVPSATSSTQRERSRARGTVTLNPTTHLPLG